MAEISPCQCGCGTFWFLVGARVDRRRDQHSGNVGIPCEKQKNASLHDYFDVGIAGTDDFSLGGDGSSFYGETLGVFSAFSNCLRNPDEAALMTGASPVTGQRN
jgi:hypothetical protein